MTKTTSKNPHGQGFREVEVVQEIEYLEVESTETLILKELAKQPLPACIIAKRLKMPETTAGSAAQRMVRAGQLTSRKAMVMMNGVRRSVVLYSPTK